MRKRVVVGMLALLTLGMSAQEAHATTHYRPSYRSQVIAGTKHYRPCVKLNATREGRLWYRDMVSDTYDDGHKRSVKAQIHYVRTGCVSIVKGK
jgi:MOSC domain-containing protein YiiM